MRTGKPRRSRAGAVLMAAALAAVAATAVTGCGSPAPSPAAATSLAGPRADADTVSPAPAGSPASAPAVRIGWYRAGRPVRAGAGLRNAPYFVALISVPPGPAGTEPEVVNAVTGKRLALVPSPDGNPFQAVAAAADDRTFFLVNGAFVYELRLWPDGRPRSLTRVLDTPGNMGTGVGYDIAVSPDATELAYATADGIEIVSLKQRTTRSWTAHGGGTADDLSFAGDRTLAFAWLGNPGSQVRILDTAAPGQNLLSSRLLIPDAGYPLITLDGSKVFATVSYQHQGNSEFQLAEFSGLTGRRLATLTPPAQMSGHGYACMVLWADPSGGQLTESCASRGVIADRHFTRDLMDLPVWIGGAGADRSVLIGW
jgi:hypothetical protein